MKVLRILKVVLINLVSFIVLLFIVNAICGWYLKRTPQLTRDSLPNYNTDRAQAKAVFKDYNSIQHEYEPFVGWKTKPYKGPTTHINSEGIRVHTPPMSNTNDSTIVRFFGGSTMWGEGSDDQHTIPALFHAQYPSAQVINHGQLAYNTRQELDALISLYSRGEKADVVIFYDGVNDAAFLCPSEIKSLPAHRLVPLFRQKLYVARSAFIKEALYKGFVENLHRLVLRYGSKNEKESPYDCLSTPGKAAEIASIFVKNWELAHEIVTARGGTFIAVLQPAAFIGNPRTDHLTLDNQLGENFQEVYKHIQANLAAKQYDWVFDLSDKFDGNEHIFIDFCHVSPNGNEIIAKEISGIVKGKR